MRSSTSGRVVIDITPEEKRAIYAELKARGGLTMREWFKQKAIEDGLLSRSSQDTESNSKEES
ncbi:hypothetical protein [Halomonas sp. KO116]|uniref:hypothetical protein n=1 Tax=Halomonas sp. KO116 TaxID=1504981 RepID=UPI0004E3D568|nr:hypothetical protein [Halomonas sp. KO116]AJY53215.1 hypothetical protein KO116_P200108 [Halomonas sp. KO116]